MNKFSFIIIFSCLTAITFSQENHKLQRLIYEFPFGRPSNGPMLNEIEIAPRFDFVTKNNSSSIASGIDLEYALNNKLILEAGASFAKSQTEPFSFLQEQGLELAAFYTLTEKSNFALTLGLESKIPFEQEENENESFSLEPQIITGFSSGSFQFHFCVNAELNKTNVYPGGYFAAIYNSQSIRPFIQLIFQNSIDHSIYFSPGMVVPVNDDFQCGIGFPIGIGNNSNNFGISLYMALELGDDEK